jgi:hypothetical protein
MGIRKNAKLLTSLERENFVKACVMMKADIVNPGAAAAAQYSRWDENVAIHLMIQLAFAPGATSVNFGHGSGSSYAFLSWHRYFLYQIEQQLQGYVPGVMIPYWDWTDPTSLLSDTFIGPDSGGGVVTQGYFAFDKPGGGSNATPLPAWWPASLVGWRLPGAFGIWAGGLVRDVGGALPSATHLRQTLQMSSYAAFQGALERGTGLSPAHGMHNSLHGYIGGHMSNPTASPFDPIFYLHHCNIDRIWAHWQVDGHADLYPASGGNLHHNRDDLMYPWVGTTAGYGTNASINGSIPMPDHSALGPQTNGSTLDHRSAYGYTYDTIAVVGIGLDRTGSMSGLTPDPMTTGAPDVTKWEAAKRGVSAFLQDCETVQESGVACIVAGVKTFRSLGAINAFDAVFPSPGYGIVKAGGTCGKTAFDNAVATMATGGGTPLADALSDVQDTLVVPPLPGGPADEQRYIAMLTDGLLTSGSPMSSIPDGSLSGTAIFGLGFGTGADVDLATIAGMVAKGRILSTTQSFNGANAGTIAKFYDNSLAAAIGFTPVLDPVVELFAQEFAHVDFHVTSADEAVLITAQGMDFVDDNWTYGLHGPGGLTLYGKAEHGHGDECHHCCPAPEVTASRSDGRLTLMIQRGNAGKHCWVGRWQLMVAYRSGKADGMVMPEIGEWLFPVTAGPVRGARFSKLLTHPRKRVAKRNVFRRALHRLDSMPVSTNSNDREACDVVVNVSMRTRLRLELAPRKRVTSTGDELAFDVHADVLTGNVSGIKGFARLVAPTVDFGMLASRVRPDELPERARLADSKSFAFDPAHILAILEQREPKLFAQRDEEVEVAIHGDGAPHVHVKRTEVPGTYHLGVYLEGFYCPEHARSSSGAHDHASAPARDPAHAHATAESCCGPDCDPEFFTRLLTTVACVAAKK